MKEYSVVLHYSVRVEAEDEETAEEMGWQMLGKADPTSNDDFSCEVEQVVNVWDTNENGLYTCVDCEFTMPEAEVLGNRQYGEPRCEGCYEEWKYRS